MHRDTEAKGGKEERFEKIGPTAHIVAYRRSLSDIPFAKDIYNAVKGSSSPFSEELYRSDLAPEIEARYRIVDLYLAKSGIHQILELASGLSPRGAIMSANPEINYVELDLDSMTSVKKDIVSSLGLSDRHNLHLLAGNALSQEDLHRATSGFDSNQPLAVVNEGLMRYLTIEERAKLAANVHVLLSKFGGVWITPDISLKRVLDNENKKDASHLAQISNLTGANIIGNRFETLEQAKEFFGRPGFDIEVHSWLEVGDQLTSPEAVGASHADAVEMISFPVLFVMNPKQPIGA